MIKQWLETVAAWSPQEQLTAATVVIFNLVVFWMSLSSDPMDDHDGRI